MVKKDTTMIIEKAHIKQFEDIRLFYHSLIDGMIDSKYVIGWKKDIYPEPKFLMNSISKGELFVRLINNQIIAAMIINHESNEEYNNFDWPTKASDNETLYLTNLL